MILTATQGLGEVSGTAIEAPMRIIYEVNVIKGKRYLIEPQYETNDYYAVTGFGTSIDLATKKAITYMVDYLAAEHDLSRQEAYVCVFSGRRPAHSRSSRCASHAGHHAHVQRGTGNRIIPNKHWL